MNNFQFLRPAWFGLIPLLLLLLWCYHRRKALSRSWQAVCDPELLPHLLVGSAEGRNDRKPLTLMAISGGLILFALAGPVWKQLEQPVFRDQSALVLILDLSRSMDATDIIPTRLNRARHKLIDILKNRQEGETALVIYAADAFVVSPLTQDAETIISQVSALKTTLIPRQGSRPDIALRKAVQLLEQAGSPKGRVLMITDGLENVPKADLQKAVSRLKSQGNLLSILGVGTLEGAPIKLEKGGFLRDRNGTLVITKLDEAGLKRLTRQGGGQYHRLSIDESDIDRLLGATIIGGPENPVEESGLKTDRWREEGPWLLLVLLPLAALTFRRGTLAMILFLCLFLPYSAEAFDWEGLWLRQDQRAANALTEGDEAAAATLFKDPEWKATAQYRSGAYQKSIDALEGIQSPDALYNRGNALAQLGRLPEAIQAYDEALKLDPRHEDALYNKKELQKQMEQQEQNQEENQKGEGNSEDKAGDPSEQRGEDPAQDSQGDPEDSASDQQNQDESDTAQNSKEPGNRNQNRDDPAEKNQETAQGGKPDPSESDTDASKEREENTSMAKVDSEASEEGESVQAIEQWLRRIPDDPGGLLRRKFLYQSRQQETTSREDKEW